MKHFNKATIKGMLKSFEVKAGEEEDRLSIVVECTDKENGDVIVNGNLWKDDSISAFEKRFIIGDLIHLSCLMSQYKGRHDAVRTNFLVFDFKPWDPGEEKHAHKRTTFVMCGEVTSLEPGEDEHKLTVMVKSKDGRENHLEVQVPDELVLSSRVATGATVKVKGKMARELDEFGETVKHQRPVVAGIEIIEAAPPPF